MKSKILLFFGLIITSFGYSQSTLSAGDIAIIQYNADGNPEIIKFLALTTIESGTTINFTDNGWITTGTPAFRTNEGVHTWTAATKVNCGDVVTMSIPNGSFNLGSAGDQIFAYQGTLASPTFIFGINNQSAGVWQTSATTARNSGLPAALTNGMNAVAIQEVDNVIYSGSLTGSRATILSNICNKANWNSGTTATSSNTANQNFTSTFNSTATYTTSWDVGPNDYFTAVIDGNYTEAGTISICNCTVNATRTLTVTGTITVENDITNNGTIQVNSGGSIVQIEPTGTNTGTDYNVDRTTTNLLSEHQYTYWSSPLTSSTLNEVTTNADYYYSFATGSQSWASASNATVMTPGIGYISNGPTDGAFPGTYTANFSGSAFNNGNVTIALGYNADADTDNDWNLIGNPYPSAISANTFLMDNAATLGGTIYFWTHNTDASYTVNYSQNDYAMWNAMGGTAAVTGGTVPTGNIASGQGFFAQAIASGNATFTNSMRIVGSNTNFYRTASTSSKQTVSTDKKKKKKKKAKKRNRIWLNLTNAQSFSQTLIGFAKDATNGVDHKYDGKRLTGSATTNFYSIINAEPYGIQGLPKLKKKKRIPLGYTTSNTGDFTMSIANVEGEKLKKFKVILLDKVLNVRHNLKNADYTFTNEIAGTYDDRFILILKKKKKRKKADDEDDEENHDDKQNVISFYKDNQVIVKSNKIIQTVSVYNIFGHLIRTNDTKGKEVRTFIDKTKKLNLLIVKIRLTSGVIITKKIVVK